MRTKHFDYCIKCSQEILGAWKGWPHRDPIPLLPRMIDGRCENCCGTEFIVPTTISWLNYHSADSTGLPDYWLLRVAAQLNNLGQPYYGEINCPNCNCRSTVSQMHYPNGTDELCLNCANCGVIIVPFPVLFTDIPVVLVQDPWFKIVEFLQQNWAVIIQRERDVLVVFYDDCCGVFDEIPFQTYDEADLALKRNGFSKFKRDKNAQECIGLPEGDFMMSRHPNGRIYSSGRFWR